jgi:hypothetical protein
LSGDVVQASKCLKDVLFIDAAHSTFDGSIKDTPETYYDKVLVLLDEDVVGG